MSSAPHASEAASTTLLPRLLRGVGSQPLTRLHSHVDLHGPLPTPCSREELLALVERSGLRGRGGAAFPAARKLASVASRRGTKVVVVNGVEGEPASKKDRALLHQAPHLVLDGAAVAAHAVGTREVYVMLSERDHPGRASLVAALADRATLLHDPQFRLLDAPERFITGQETALVNVINGGPSLPTFGTRPYERGVDGRPTLVQNAETLAHLALIARHGPEWFRQLGTDSDPGSALLTVSGAVESPGVYEIEHGTPLAFALDCAGVIEPLRAVLIGGYFGSWLPAEAVPGTRLSPGALREQGASLGAGVIVALGESACPVAEVSRITDWFADQTAGQCGPCVNGLGAIADAFGELADGVAEHGTIARVDSWTRDIVGRGACQHPDGAARFIRSALQVFAPEIEDHAARGPCERCEHPPLLQVPAALAA